MKRTQLLTQASLGLRSEFLELLDLALDLLELVSDRLEHALDLFGAHRELALGARLIEPALRRYLSGQRLAGGLEHVSGHRLHLVSKLLAASADQLYPLLRCP